MLPESAVLQLRRAMRVIPIGKRSPNNRHQQIGFAPLCGCMGHISNRASMIGHSGI